MSTRAGEAIGIPVQKVTRWYFYQGPDETMALCIGSEMAFSVPPSSKFKCLQSARDADSRWGISPHRFREDKPLAIGRHVVVWQVCGRQPQPHRLKKLSGRTRYQQCGGHKNVGREPKTVLSSAS